MPRKIYAINSGKDKDRDTKNAEEQLINRLRQSAGDTDLNGNSITLVSLSESTCSKKYVNGIAKDIAAEIAAKFNPDTKPEIYIIAPLAFVEGDNISSQKDLFQDVLEDALKARGFQTLYKLPIELSSQPGCNIDPKNIKFEITSIKDSKVEVVLDISSNYIEKMKSPGTAISESASLLDSDPSASSGWYESLIQYLPWVAPVFGADNLNAMKVNEKKFNSLMKEYSYFVDQTCTFNGSDKTLSEVFTEQSLRKPTMVFGKVVQSFNTSAWKWLLAPLDKTASTDARFIDVSQKDKDYLSQSKACAILTVGDTKVEVKYPDLLAKRTELQENIKPLLAERAQITSQLKENLTKYDSSSQNDSKKAVVKALIQYVEDPSTATWAAVTSATKENKGWNAGLTSRVRRMHDRLKEVHEESIKPESSKLKP